MFKNVNQTAPVMGSLNAAIADCSAGIVEKMLFYAAAEVDEDD